MLHTEQPAFIFFHRNFPLAVIKFFFVDWQVKRMVLFIGCWSADVAQSQALVTESSAVNHTYVYSSNWFIFIFHRVDKFSWLRMRGKSEMSSCKIVDVCSEGMWVAATLFVWCGCYAREWFNWFPLLVGIHLISVFCFSSFYLLPLFLCTTGLEHVLRFCKRRHFVLSEIVCIHELIVVFISCQILCLWSWR